jgi:putative flippase GtrA
VSRGAALRAFASEGARYLVAGTIALAADLGVYSTLIRLLEVNYLVAAPIGFAVGLTVIYGFSVRWIFGQRRLADPRAEFAIFALIGLAGLALNQLVIYTAVEWLALGYEPAKLVSAALVFGFNFICRKLLLFTRF